MKELFVPFFNFSILVGLMVYFLVPLFKKSVANRHDQVKKFVEEARQQKLEAEKKYKEFETKLKNFEIEAKEILARAQSDGEALKAKIVMDARATAEKIIQDAESQAAANLAEFKDELRRKAIEKAVAAAETLIKDKLSQDDQKRIIRDYVEKVQ